MSLLRTRLFKPVVSKGYLIRERLLERMNASRDKSIHKVIAAAGYGKSIFLSQWLDEINGNHCWISLEKDCNDIGIFFRYFSEAIKSIDQSAVSELIELESAIELPQHGELAIIIANALHQIDDPANIVLDDYHTITNQEVHLFLTDLINHFPEQHRIILISRYDPPLDLRKLLAYDKVNELRMADLMFTPEEIIALSHTQTNKTVSREAADFIYDKTEGWIVPIRLWLKELSSEKGTNRLAIDKNPQLSSKLTYDLLEDVFSALDTSVRENLMLASLFPRFSIEFLKGLHPILHPGEEQAFDPIKTLLENLIDRSLFIMALDDEENWYRFHHLVHEFLQTRSKRRFTTEAIAKAIDYGSSYFAAHDSIYLAIQLSIQNENYSGALHFFNRDRYKLFDKQRFDQFRLWLNLFPEEVIESEPSLLLIRAALFNLYRKEDRMSEDLDRVRNLLPPLEGASDTTKALWGEYYSTSTQPLFVKQEMNQVIQFAKKAMSLLQNKSSYLHDYAMSLYVLALNSVGKTAEARSFLDLYEKSLKDTDSTAHMNFDTIYAIFGFMQGGGRDALKKSLSARDLAIKHSNAGVLLMANYYTAVALYQRNDLEGGLQYLEEALQSRYVTRPTWIIECYFLKCLFHMAMSDDTRNEQCFEEMLAFQNKFGSILYKHSTTLMRTEIFLRQGEADKAWDTWKQVPGNSLSFGYHYYQSKLTEVRLLLADHPFQNLERAEDLIIQYETQALATGNRNLYFQSLALKIILFQIKNDSQKAIGHLRTLLSKTKEGSIVRLYSDHGKPMQSLIDQLSTKERSDPYILEIARSFKSAEEPENRDATVLRLPLNDANSIEFSKKEIQILQLISEGYQNKEIAEKLFHSLGTVKTYIYNLYQKIGVSNRAQAIRFHKEMGNTPRVAARSDFSHS